MTREEAIKTLKENYCSMCAYGSCDMDSCDISYCDNREAIEVLSALPEREKGTDLISRTDTLNAICKAKCNCSFEECPFTEHCTYCEIIINMPNKKDEVSE